MDTEAVAACVEMAAALVAVTETSSPLAV